MRWYVEEVTRESALSTVELLGGYFVLLTYGTSFVDLTNDIRQRSYRIATSLNIGLEVSAVHGDAATYLRYWVKLVKQLLNHRLAHGGASLVLDVTEAQRRCLPYSCPR